MTPKTNSGEKEPSVAVSSVPHVLFIISQIYCGFLVIFLLGPSLYAIINSYKLGIITINFSDLFFSFSNWWGELSALSTIGITLIIFCCFLIGFIFTETFYRLATTLPIRPLNDYVPKRDFKDKNSLEQLFKKNIIKEDKSNPDYVYVNNFIKTEGQLTKRLNFIEKNSVSRPIFNILRKSIKWRPYIKDINLEDLRGGKTDDEKHFKIRCGIQKNAHLQRVWDWENFQFNFCLYIEMILLVFNFLFGFSIVYTFIFKNLLEIFWMYICLAILVFAIILTMLMKIARIEKLKKFHHAHKVIEKILDEKKNQQSRLIMKGG